VDKPVSQKEERECAYLMAVPGRSSCLKYK